MYVWLSQSQVNAIVRHAQNEAPHEACGVIGGKDGRALKIIPITNVSPTPSSNYFMDAQELTAALFQLETEGLSLIGFYHSHPNERPIPSQTDIKEAAYPDTAYLIVSLMQEEPRLAAWLINYGQVESVTLHVGDFPPEVIESSTHSKAQRIAIILSAILAFLIVLTLSLSLLPAPPPLPIR